MITKPNIPVVRPARVTDDGRFLRWVEYASEALPVDVAANQAAEGGGADRDLDEIPAAIVVKRKPGRSSAGTPGRKLKSVDRLPERRGDDAPKAGLKNLAGEVPRGKAGMPTKRRVARAGTEGKATEPKPLDTSKFSSFEEYNEGKTRVAPLQRGSAMDGRRGNQRPKFLDGKLPRSVERGVLHPQPGRLVVSSLLLLLSKLLLVAVVVVMPITAFLDSQLPPEFRHYTKDSLPLLLLFAAVGVAFVVVANKARCRVCSCHFFFTRRCHKHKSAHRLFLVGAAGTAALHLLLFKWMRCMYCGTAIRLRGSTGVGRPSKDGSHYASEEAPDEGEGEGPPA